MKFVDFFVSHIKPYTQRGKRMLNPAATGIIGHGVSCIKEYDVNIWLYTKGNTTIAIDSGYKNYPDIDAQFCKIGVEPQQVRAVFMTHTDVDHGGGMDKHNKLVFPAADVYLGENEEVHLTNQSHRFKFAFIKIKNSVQFREGYRLLKDGDSVQVGGIKIQAIDTPGHTMGHTCYLIDDEVLFSGDCLAVNKTGGYCLFDFFNMDSKLNIKSLHNLQKRIIGKPLKMLCTGHSGFTYDVAHSFDHIDKIAKSSRKYPFDPDAPYDVFNS